MPQAGGAKFPPGPPVEVSWFLTIPTPTKLAPVIHNLKSKLENLKNKKICSQKKWSVTIILFMNCKIAYITYRVPLGHVYESPADIFRISKIHSRQLIILWFSVFLPKKKNFQSLKIIVCTINTAFTSNWLWWNNHHSMSLDGWDILENVILVKFCKKKEKKNFDLE